MKTMITAQELKMRFLQQAAPIVDSYVNAALGIEDLKSLNMHCRTEVWDLVKQLILKSSDTVKMTITKPKDIIKAVEEGRCTMEEGQRLLAMYKALKEMENMQAEDGKALPVLNITLRDENGEREIQRS